MTRLHKPSRLRFAFIFSLAALVLLLTACLGSAPVTNPQQPHPTAAQPLPQPGSAAAAAPTAIQPTETALIPTPEPSTTSTPIPSHPAAAGPLADFPRFAGAQEEPGAAGNDLDHAFLTLHTDQNPAEIDAYYRQELARRGWTLRYADSTPAGGFIQEWKKDQSYLTVTYGFTAAGPLVQADLRRIDASKALVVLMGFPLPNGTEVTRVDGSALELFVPQDINSAEQFFWKALTGKRWLAQEIPVKAGCTLRGCPEVPQSPANASITRLAVPTPDYRPGIAYHATLPDFTQVDIILLPRQADTIAYVNVNYKNPVRSGLPVTVYPRANVTSAVPSMIMFDTPDDMQKVVKFYEDALYGLGYRIGEVYADQPDSYSKTWLKGDLALTVTLTRANKRTYAAITCKSCRPLIPTAAPTPTPTKAG